ncbi:MAG TPA: hypothetical protein VK002_05260, partial [Rubricoccaceae bacterium]|nr:hypothetical protein [Rubricoccaceae bacterium]
YSATAVAMKISRRGHYRNHGTFVLVEDDLTNQKKRCRYGSDGPRWDKREGAVSFCGVQEDEGEPGAATHQYSVALVPREVLALVGALAPELCKDEATSAVFAGAKATIESLIIAAENRKE